MFLETYTFYYRVSIIIYTFTSIFTYEMYHFHSQTMTRKIEANRDSEGYTYHILIVINK